MIAPEEIVLYLCRRRMVRDWVMFNYKNGKTCFEFLSLSLGIFTSRYRSTNLPRVKTTEKGSFKQIQTPGLVIPILCYNKKRQLYLQTGNLLKCKRVNPPYSKLFLDQSRLKISQEGGGGQEIADLVTRMLLTWTAQAGFTHIFSSSTKTST